MPLFKRFAAFAMTFALLSSAAQARTLLRDADIEFHLARVAQPVLEAAGLAGQVRIFVVQENSLNAFVANHRAIFLHSGLLNRFDSPEPIQAVIAHEAAHIANGHIARRIANYGRSSTASTIGLILSGLAAASGAGEAAAGLAIGSQEAAKRNFLTHTRAEETSADQSALKYLARAGIDPSAMSDVLDLFHGQEALSHHHKDPYALTHPLTRDRQRTVNSLSQSLQIQNKKKNVSYAYQRAIGKLSAFTRSPSWTLRKVRGKTDELSVMRRAIAHHRQAKSDAAIKEMQKLLRLKPKDGFYQELYGQILLESRKVKQSVSAYESATKTTRDHPLVKAGLGRALLAQNTPASNKRALNILKEARLRDTTNAALLRDLALAHARAGELAMASVATAERYALTGRMKDAKLHATRALGQLPQGSRGYRRAADVESAAKRALKK